jgi:hypothetical protein
MRLVRVEATVCCAERCSGAITYTKSLKTKDYVDTKFADNVPKAKS